MLSEEEAAFVRGQRVGVLATVSAGGSVHAIPVCFIYEEGRFFTPIDEKPKRSLNLRRLRNIRQNPNVAMLFHRYSDNWKDLAYLLVQGTAAVLESGNEHQEAIVRLREKYPQYRDMKLEERAVIKIVAEKVAAWGSM